MQLQILFTDDTAWMNLIDSRYNKSFQVEIAKSKEIPLYFAIDDDGQIFGGATARNYYFKNFTDLANLENTCFGNLLDYIRTGKTFVNKGENRPGAYLATWLFDQAEAFLKKNSGSDDIDDIAIAGYPAWEDEDLKELKLQLSTCRPTEIVPISHFFSNAAFVVLPVNRCFKVGTFESELWKEVYSSPMIGADLRIRSMAKRMAFQVNEQSRLDDLFDAEVCSCESYLKWNNVLELLESGRDYDGAYKGASKRGLREIPVSFTSKERLTGDDEKTMRQIAIYAFGYVTQKGDDKATVEFVGDGYCFPEFKKSFEEKKDTLNTIYTSTSAFLNRIFSREWSKASMGANIKSVSTLSISNLQPNDIVYLHGADFGKPDSEKELRYLGNNRFETIRNSRGWSSPHDILVAQEMLWCVGQKLRLKLEKTGQIAVTRTITEIKAPVKEVRSVPQSSAAPKAASACASAFEVAGSAGIEKNVSLNEINISSLNAGDIVSLHGVDPNGVKAPTRKELRYLGGGRFETIENTRGWSHAGDIVVAKDSVWTLHQSLRFMLERTGQVASTRMIDSMQVK